MKILAASLIMPMMMPALTGSTHHKSQATAPIASVAYAESTKPSFLKDCPCQVIYGVSRDCNGNLCTEDGSAIKTENNSANRIATSPMTASSLSMWARALLSVIAILAWSET